MYMKNNKGAFQILRNQENQIFWPLNHAVTPNKQFTPPTPP